MEKLKVEKYSESNKIDYFGEEYATTYTTKYVAKISNTYLNKYRTIKAQEL